MGIEIKKIHGLLIFADQIDIITNFAVIMNIVIKRLHCIWRLLNSFEIGGLGKEHSNINLPIFEFQYIYICSAKQRFRKNEYQISI